MTRKEAETAERKVSRALADMRLVYEDEVGADGSEPTKSQVVLQKLFEDSPDKFMLRMERLQVEHDKKIAAIEAREAAQAGGAGPATDEKDVKCEEVLNDLLAQFDPVEEALRYQFDLRKDGSPFDVVSEAERYVRERQSRQPRL